MPIKDYYKLLGVARDASPADIKKAYRKQARKFHPDMNKATDATQAMADINEANAVLSDAEKRLAYDTQGVQRDDPPPQADSTSDFFEELFGRGMYRTSPPGPQRGHDQHASITLDLTDAYQGATKSLHLHGVASALEVKIPKGVFEGQQIRLGGHGSAGSGGGAAGDLLLEVHFKTDTRWRTMGRDVYGALPLSPWEAVLSPWLEVKTPVGVAEVKIPADWKAGRSLRLKGHGIPGNAHKAAGDLYLELAVVLPAANSSQARAAYSAMAQAFPDFNPRAS